MTADALFDARHHKEPLAVEDLLWTGRYLGTPVLVVRDDGDGFFVSMYPDRTKPGRSHGKEKPFTFDKGEWWRVWGEQIIPGDFDYEAPAFPLVLEPKPVPE